MTFLGIGSRKQESALIQWGGVTIILQVTASRLDGDRASFEASLRRLLTIDLYQSLIHIHTHMFMHTHICIYTYNCVHMHTYVYICMGT